MFLPTLICILSSAIVDPPEGSVPAVEKTTPSCCEPGAVRARAVSASIVGEQSQETKGEATAPMAPDVEKVLDLVDRQSALFRNYRGRISMETYDDLADETERRFGRVWLVAPESDNPATRQAAVVFDRLVESSGRIREKTEHWVYREGILSDYDHEAKRLVRRRILDPDEKRDPLRLGEGPIPIPIGQRKEDIVAAFEVSLAGPVPERLARRQEGVMGIRLVPRDGTRMARDEDMASIDYWVRSGDGEPVAIEVIEKDRDRVAIRFFESTFNEAFGGEAERWLIAPEVDPETWRIQDQ